jgi:hypothetical protein
MYKNSQTANNVFHLTLFNQEVKLPVSVLMQDHHQVLTSYLIANSIYHAVDRIPRGRPQYSTSPAIHARNRQHHPPENLCVWLDS